MDYYTFRRELDFSTNFPEIILDLKKSRQFRKMNLEEKYGLYDNMYSITKKYFLSHYVSEEEKNMIEKAATQQIMKRGLQELEKTLQ